MSNKRKPIRSKARSSPNKLYLERLEPRCLLAVIPVPLANSGFESPALSAENAFYSGAVGWNTSGSIATIFESPTASPSLAAEGDQFALGDSRNWQMWQQGPAVTAGTRYILKVDVFPLATGTPTVAVQLRDSDTGAIFSGAANYFSPNPRMRQVEVAAGQWTTLTIAFHSDELTEALGKTLEVRILGSRFAVDNARLTTIDSAEAIYVSASSGAAGNDGFSESAPLGGFADLAPYLPLRPGERLLLKAGDSFSEELNVRGKGTADNPIVISRYGEGPNPVIDPNNTEDGLGLVWNNASYARISGIDVQSAKIGVYLRYEWTDTGSRDVVVENSNFRNLSDATLDPTKHNYEFAWSDAIWVGGQAWNQAEFANRLDGLTIRNVTADTVGHLFGTNFYYPGVYKSRVTNLLIEDCLATNSLGTFALFGVDGGIIRRFTSIGGVQRDTWAGSTLGFIQNSKNVVIEDSLFASISRAQSADGSGMDFEGNTENVTFRNNVVHSNAGSALLILTTQGPNKNLVITGNTIYNNAVDPWNSEINSEIQLSGSGHTGTIANNGIYRRSAGVNFFSPGGDWSGFTLTGNREADYALVRDRPRWWDFADSGSFDGWGGINQWNDATVSGGLLTGVSSGVDPYIESPPTWVDSNTSRYVWVRMSQTSGAFGQVFFQTETDPMWDGAKSVAFPIVADGQMHDYFVDLSQLPTLNGVITRVRLDPTVEAGSTMAIDFVRLTSSTDPGQAAPATPSAEPTTVTLTSIAAEDGHVLESTRDSGVGGSVSRTSTTFRLGDDSNNRAYRPILSFDTSSIPDSATIVEATLGITRVGNPTGTIPIGVADSPWGDLLVDLAVPGFDDPTLDPGDFSATAAKLGVSKFAWPAYANGMTIYSRMEGADASLINLTGRTQFRIRYQHDDDNDNTADYMPYASGNAFNASQRPTLTIRYVVQPDLPGDYDGNGLVEDADRGVWRSNFGLLNLGRSGDGNGDGVINAADYTVWRDNLGASAAIAVEASIAGSVDSLPIQPIATAVHDAEPFTMLAIGSLTATPAGAAEYRGAKSTTSGPLGVQRTEAATDFSIGQPVRTRPPRDLHVPDRITRPAGSTPHDASIDDSARETAFDQLYDAGFRESRVRISHPIFSVSDRRG